MHSWTFQNAKRRAYVWLIVSATLLVYEPVVNHPFINYDDDVYMTDNSHVRVGLTLDTVNWASLPRTGKLASADLGRGDISANGYHSLGC